MKPPDATLVVLFAGALLLGLSLVARRGRRGFLFVNPTYLEFLRRQGLMECEHFQALPMVIVCGHPDRHVGQLTLGSGAGALRAFLKREHRVPWRDRLASVWAGFGWVSKSYREALLLLRLHRAGIGCPEVIAAGEDGHGHAFLLLRELPEAQDLRSFLRDLRAAPAVQRRHFARQLGAELARMHAAGFDHPNLYSKHILVQGTDQAICLLDWQRSCWRRRVSWRRRCRDLAALEATLADDLATPRERLICLRAYLRTASRSAGVLSQIRRQAEALLQKRRIRELRQAPLMPGKQNLIWLDGEALCITREFYASLLGEIPLWLRTPTRQTARGSVYLPGGGQGLLVRRRVQQPLRWFWAWLRRRPLTSPELEQAGTLFRLQRYGIEAPRLLAVGQRRGAQGRTESFLLTEPPTDTVCLTTWWDDSSHPLRDRWSVIRQTAVVLRRMHEAACYCNSGFDPTKADSLQVQSRPRERPAVVLGSVDAVARRRHSKQALVHRYLLALRKRFTARGSHQTDELRFVLAYLGGSGLTPAAKHQIRHLARALRPAAARRSLHTGSCWRDAGSDAR
jgi:tRNA A-37 threonylcarbamoyl transferase component Bud32